MEKKLFTKLLMMALQAMSFITVVGVMVMWPYCSYASQVPEEGESPEVTDVTDSGCLSKTRGSSSFGLVLTKEGDVVTCEINRFVTNCGVDFFDIQSEYSKGEDAPDSLFLDVTPVIQKMDCTCSYNVSFTIRNVDSDSFFLGCNNLETIYICGKLNWNASSGLFWGMTSTPTLYVPESEVESYKKGYRKGAVLLISSSDQSLGISDVNKNTGKQVEHFDLQGRRLTSKPSKGVYIQNGRKVVIK